MDLRRITDGYAVSPQISPEDMAAIAEAGFKTVLNNRPDHEVPPDLGGEAIRRAAEAQGLSYVAVSADTRTMSLDTVDAHGRVLEEADGPVLAYCASGTRSTILWALSQAGRRDTDAIIEAAERAGYAIAPYRPQIDALAAADR